MLKYCILIIELINPFVYLYATGITWLYTTLQLKADSAIEIVAAWEYDQFNSKCSSKQTG